MGVSRVLVALLSLTTFTWTGLANSRSELKAIHISET